MKTSSRTAVSPLAAAATLAAVFAGAALTQDSATAQTTGATNAAPTPQSFFTTVAGYFTAFNTNLTTFTDTNNFHGTVWAGADYQSGVNIASSLGVEYPFYKGLTFVSVTRNADVAGTILSQQGDLAIAITHYDAQLSLGAGLGYCFANVGGLRPGLYGSVFAEAKKALTDNTFAGLRLEDDFSGKTPNIPVLSVFVGFRF
jgi:hypothetical protein